MCSVCHDLVLCCDVCDAKCRELLCVNHKGQTYVPHSGASLHTHTHTARMLTHTPHSHACTSTPDLKGLFYHRLEPFGTAELEQQHARCKAALKELLAAEVSGEGGIFA